MSTAWDSRHLYAVPDPPKPRLIYPTGPWRPWFRHEIAPVLSPTIETSGEYRRRITRSSPLRFALVYLDHYLTLQDSNPPQITFSEAHLALARSARRWIEPRRWREAWIAPRGLGKTVWAFLILPLWALAHGHRSFFLAFAWTEGQATGHLANLRMELETNKLLRDDFPELAPRRIRGASNTKSTVVSNGGTIEARGLRETVLGRRSGTERPDLIIGDDIEPLDEDHSPEKVKQVITKLTAGIFPMGTSHTALGIFGTVTMYRSLTHQLVIHGRAREEFDWIRDWEIVPRIFPGVREDPDTGELRSLWPARWELTDTHLGEYKIGTREFALNFALDPAPADATRGGGFWRPETFQRMDPNRFGAVEHVLYIDPALMTGPDNDYTAFVVVGRIPGANRAIVEYAWHGRVTGEQIRRRIHTLAEREPSLRTVVFEANAGGSEHWEATLAPPGRPLPRSIRVRYEWARGHKDARIKRAHAHYERGEVWHSREFTELEEQMIMWPDPRQHDDLIDATAGALRWAFDQ